MNDRFGCADWTNTAARTAPFDLATQPNGEAQTAGDIVVSFEIAASGSAALPSGIETHHSAVGRKQEIDPVDSV